ncbi:hypothetical protein Tcan_18990 [Toxocara canis]|uniref:Uncharacterized protein n=1 Tax=Toxocara canis TaxID=6265 RepID=A0A0B2VSA6_TOXCA|nr:hypothetical protein Tcan_18990 [Toxocara canis]
MEAAKYALRRFTHPINHFRKLLRGYASSHSMLCWTYKATVTLRKPDRNGTRSEIMGDLSILMQKCVTNR